MIVWNWFNVGIAAVSALLFIYLMAVSFRGAPVLISALPLAEIATVFAALYGSALVGRLAALLCVGFGIWALVSFSKDRSRLPLVRFLRLLSAGCCTATGALLLAFPFPPASLVARAAWFVAGFFAWVPIGVFLGRGECRESLSPQAVAPGRVPLVSTVLDVLAIAVSIMFLLCAKLWPVGDLAYWVVLAWIAVFAAGFLSMFTLQWVLPGRRGQPPVAGTAWGGMAIMMLGFVTGYGEARPDLAAGCRLIVGGGFGIMLWMMLMGPLISGTAGLPQVMINWARSFRQQHLNPQEDR